MKLKKQILNDLYANYFLFKLGQERGLYNEFNDEKIGILLRYIHFNLIRGEERDFVIQLLYILVELKYIKKNNGLFGYFKLFLGDFPTIKTNDLKIDDMNDAYYEESLLKHENEENILYEGQLEAKNIIKKGGNLIINAPTSFGKTKIIIENIKPFEVIIVPTVALLNEVSQELRKQRTDLEVITKSLSRPQKNSVFVFTQERMLGYLSLNNNFQFERIYVDEAHEILKLNTRSILLATLLRRQMEIGVNVTLITPNANKEVFEEVLDKLQEFSFYDFTKYSQTSRVFFIFERGKISFHNGDAKQWNKLEFKSFYANEFINNNFLNDKPMTNKKEFEMMSENEQVRIRRKENEIKEQERIKKISKINDLLNKKPVIYVPKTKVHKFATELSNGAPQNDNKDLLSQYIKEKIWDEYDLIDYSQKGILLHTGDYESVLRVFVEYLFKNMDEYSLIATSTIASGINLKTQNLILSNGRTDGNKTLIGSLKNLIGRVGRYQVHGETLLGTVFVFKGINFIKKIKKNPIVDKKDFSKENLLEISNKKGSKNIDEKINAKAAEIFIENNQKLDMFIPIANVDVDNVDIFVKKHSDEFWKLLEEGMSKRGNSDRILDILSETYKWEKGENPFAKVEGSSFMMPLKIYTNNYFKNMSIKNMVKKLKKYINNKNEPYYICKKITGAKYLSKEEYENCELAKDNDLVNQTMISIRAWVEGILLPYLFNFMWMSSKYIDESKKTIKIRNEIAYFTNEKIDMDIINLGINRQFIPEIKKYITEEYIDLQKEMRIKIPKTTILYKFLTIELGWK